MQTKENYAPIAYIYNSSQPNEYVTIYLQQGKPYFQHRMSALSSAQPTILTTNVPINNNQWHRIEFERIGKRSKLRVQPEAGGQALEATTDGSELDSSSVIFNLDPNGARLVLGQFPPEYQLPRELQTIAAYNNQFRGALDDFELNEHSYGLWNYESAKNLKGEPKRATSTVSGSGYGDLDDSRYPETGINAPVFFKEEAYLCLDPEKSALKSSFAKGNRSVIFDFKTDSPNGLIWLWFNENNQLMAIYLEGGRIRVSFMFNSVYKQAEFETSKSTDDIKSRLDDNKFHRISVTFGFRAKELSITVTEVCYCC